LEYPKINNCAFLALSFDVCLTIKVPYLFKNYLTIVAYATIYFDLNFAPWKDIPLTKEQFVVLKKLHDQDGLNQNELAFLTYRDKSSLARLLSKMEKKEYITRKQDLEDKRVNLVFLTKKGSAIFHKTKPVVKKIIGQMENSISKTEKNQIIAILKKVQTNIS